MHLKVSFFLRCFLIIGLFASCQPKDTFDWNAGLSGPKNYPSGAPFVEYFYQGKSIAGASSGTGADQGWGITSGGYIGGDKYKPVPDSMAVKWVCSIDNLVYRGGFKLPREKMLELFKRKVIDSYGVQNDYSVIVAGMAPGGNITLWMQGGYASTEIAKFKVLKGEEDKNIDDDYKKKEIKSWGDYLTYWKIHGIPYTVWEKGEKEYPYDIGFTTEEQDKKNYSIAIAGYTKDGSVIYSNEDPIPCIKWNENVKLKVEKSKKLPVQFYIQWISQNDQEWYEAQIVLPDNLENQFIEFQKKYGNNVFLIVGMEKVSENKPYTFGKIWFENAKQKNEIMKFRAAKLNVEKTRKKI
ncbi:DUF2931 family protein [uncultured Flavobacterium sp.]|uniref:DUF2931 family protein n=1 Tax=uncultured Flavobacterium sp. TaxID=165435 RepID=UPI0025EDE50E|nr:DUF2931 family protein [uncultured Flavobacterium sp.]